MGETETSTCRLRYPPALVSVRSISYLGGSATEPSISQCPAFIFFHFNFKSSALPLPFPYFAKLSNLLRCLYYCQSLHTHFPISVWRTMTGNSEVVSSRLVKWRLFFSLCGFQNLRQKTFPSSSYVPSRATKRKCLILMVGLFLLVCRDVESIHLLTSLNIDKVITFMVMFKYEELIIWLLI